MANFKICLRTQNGGGLFPVYIRITHKRQVGYIKTDKCVSKEGIKKGEIIDPFVLAHCSKTIIRYNESLNALNLDSMTVAEIVRYLRNLDEDISFSEYAQKYIKRMAYEWKMVRNSVSYSLAIQSLEHFMNTDNILCAHLTTKVVNNWIADLDSKTHRAKEHYPICVRMMFRAALDELNDLEKGIVRIKNDPFKSVKIPKADTPEKRAVDVDVLRRFFSGALPPSDRVIGEMVDPIKVSINQFYGIEINDFACSVAQTALWIAESQMLQKTDEIVGFNLEPLPLKTYTNIHEGNAIQIKWEDVIPASELNYIMGNPPFIGARWMGKEQKDELVNLFGKDWPGVGDLDYVTCWYKIASDYIADYPIRCALVSTNSITQGGAVANLWKPLMEAGIHIDFAWRTFIWDSEANMKAHVHCVIVGFSRVLNLAPKRIFDKDKVITAKTVNGYLLDAPSIFIEKQMHPICDVPEICLGGQPIDDGNLILTEEEKDELLKAEPQAEVFIRHYMMGKDFIQRKPRYCLWLKGANPSVLKSCHLILERVQKVREFRLASSRASTLKSADTPTLFGAPFECKGTYVAIPKVSSENREYVPMDYLEPEIIPGDKLFCMQGASLYDFGVMTSSAQMSWMRAVCGRLKSDYSYSNTIVYNNFPWPQPTDAQKAKIAQTAQAILDARALYPDSSLADLYDDLTMPVELRKAHHANDAAVLEAYGFPKNAAESDIVARLFKMYQELTK